jgi:hypothetical protein
VALTKIDVVGLREAQAVFRQLEPTTREVWVDYVITPTASEMARTRASLLVPGRGRVTGQLQKAQGFTVNKRSGSAIVGTRLGFDTFKPGRNGSASLSAGARAHRPTRIGHLVNFGHGGPHPARATNFAEKAAAAEEGPMLQRSKHAGRMLEQRMGDIGNVGRSLL